MRYSQFIRFALVCHASLCYTRLTTKSNTLDTNKGAYINMGKLIIPNEINIKGPWILEENQFEELNDALIEIEKIIFESYEVEVEREIEEELPHLSQWNEKVSRQEARNEIEKTYSFAKNEQFAMLLSKDGKRLRDTSLIGLIKDKYTKDFTPSELQIKIEKGPISFMLEINSRYSGELQTRISINEDRFANDINYILNKWVRKNKPNGIVQVWSSLFPSIIFPLFILLGASSLLIKTDEKKYEEEIKRDGIELLENGINESEIKEAIEIVLKIQTDYVPDDYKNESSLDSNKFNIWIYGFICLALLSISPKTTLGLGKKKGVALFYKTWIYIVTVFIPLTIIWPILQEKIF